MGQGCLNGSTSCGVLNCSHGLCPANRVKVVDSVGLQTRQTQFASERKNKNAAKRYSIYNMTKCNIIITYYMCIYI